MEVETAAISDDNDVDFFIDITDQVCPLTFVKTKLLIERMQAGQTAEVRLKGQEPLENVPRSVEEHGHTIVRLSPEDPEGPADGVYRMILKKV